MPPVAAAIPAIIGGIGAAAAPVAGAIGSGLGAVGAGLGSAAGLAGEGLGALGGLGSEALGAAGGLANSIGGSALGDTIGTVGKKVGADYLEKQASNALYGDPVEAAKKRAQDQAAKDRMDKLSQMLSSGSSQGPKQMGGTQVNMPQVMGMPQPGQMI